MKIKNILPAGKCFLAMIIAVLMLGLSMTALQGASTWDGGGTNELWTTAENWDNDAVPAFGNTADITFNTPGAFQTVNAIGNDTTIRSLTLDANATSANIVVLPRASMNLDAAARALIFEAPSGNASITIPADATAKLQMRGQAVANGFGGVIQLNSSLEVNHTGTPTLTLNQMALGQNNDGVNANSETVIQGTGELSRTAPGT